MAKCKNCGSKIDKNTKFCMQCGAPVSKKLSKQPPNITFIQPNFQTYSSTAPKCTKRKKWLVILAISLIVSLLIVIGSIFLIDSLHNTNTAQNDKPFDDEEEDVQQQNFEASIVKLPDDYITFEQIDTTVAEIGDEPLRQEIISFFPSVGTVGSAIEITGANIDSQSLQRVTLGQWELPLVGITTDSIQVSVTSEITKNIDYELKVEFTDGIVSLGTFAVVEPNSKTLFSNEITDISITNRFYSEQVNVFIPPGALSQPDTLTVHRIEDTLECPLDDGDGNCIYFDISIGDQQQFNDMITIEFPAIPVDPAINDAPVMLTFNETTGSWDLAYTEITPQGTLALYTDHLSYFAWLPLYTTYYTDDCYFSIYYKMYDDLSAPDISDMDSLAASIGNVLTAAREAYDRELSYALPKPKLIPYEVLLSSKYNEGGAYMNPLFDKVNLPTEYKSEESIKTTAAHELLHLYQNQTLNYSLMNSRKWLTEAMAEYASYKVAFGLTPKVWEYTNPAFAVYKCNGTHEYSMASFLDYLLTKYNKSFSALYNEYVNNKDESALIILEKALQPASDFTISDEYKQFWMQVYTAHNPDAYPDPESYLAGIKLLIGSNGVKKEIKAKISNPDGILFKGIQVIGAKENVPLRFIRVNAISNDFDLKAITLDADSKDFEDALEASIGTGQWEWVSSITDISINSTYKTFTLDENDIILLAFLEEGTHTVLIREIDAVVQTKELGNITNGSEVEIIYGFNNIFEECTELLVETDFGDGNTISEKFPGQQTINVRNTYRYVKMPSDNITGSLYDISDGKKELIAQVVIPVSVDITVELEAGESKIYKGGTASFSVNVDDDTYKYIWNFGDSTALEENNQNILNHVYTDMGTFNVEVSVYDAKGELIGIAKCSIEVIENENNPEIIPDTDVLSLDNICRQYTGTFVQTKYDVILFDTSEEAKKGFEIYSDSKYSENVGVTVIDTGMSVTQYYSEPKIMLNFGMQVREKFDVLILGVNQNEDDSFSMMEEHTDGSYYIVTVNFTVSEDGNVSLYGTYISHSLRKSFPDNYPAFVHEEYEFYYQKAE